MRIPRNPRLLEVNARLWLRRAGRRTGSPLDLSAIPDDALSTLSGRFDLLWLMGVWRRSPAARQRALRDAVIRAACSEALPGCSEDDVDGSPYAIHAYEPDPILGGDAGLAALRRRLRGIGIGLVVDFVPNHLALDHPWTLAHPERFVRGEEHAHRSRPDDFFRTARGDLLAHGRDPNFPPWNDTAQIDFFSGEARCALVGELLSIAERADGVRCDMAMLALNDVFSRVWGGARGATAGPAPATEFWSEAIGAVKERHPEFFFLAEAYWGLEPRLLDLGFDYVYDKGLYDALLASDIARVRGRLAEPPAVLGRGMRFIENHDEARAISAFGPERSRAAAIVVMTLPGLRLVHDGQPEGRRRRVPVQLVREPDEAIDPVVATFYERLFAACADPAFRDGRWAPLQAHPLRPGDDGGHGGLLAWCWVLDDRPFVVVVNYSDRHAAGRIDLPRPPGGGVPLDLVDRLSGAAAVLPAGEEAGRGGLAVSLAPWEGRILGTRPSTA